MSDGHGGQAVGTVNVSVDAGDKTVDAPPVKGGVATNVSRATAFLYTGPNAIQTGVAPNAFEEKRIAVLRGKVTTRDGNVLPGVTVSIVDHPEFGQTTTRANGFFDMAVNGGGPLTIHYSAAGFLPVQKQVNAPWQDYVAVPTVALIPLDPQVTTIAVNSPVAQVHQGSAMTDSDGSRRIVIVFPAGTTATMTLPDGSQQALTTMHVRTTEYTVGPNGPVAMPANLPGLSGYTYCVELSVDEAIAAGAVAVVFSQPVVTYVENFLKFPVGTDVPSASTIGRNPPGCRPRTGASSRSSASPAALPTSTPTATASPTAGSASLRTNARPWQRPYRRPGAVAGRGAAFFARGQQLAVFDSDRRHFARRQRRRTRSERAAAGSAVQRRQHRRVREPGARGIGADRRDALQPELS